MSAPPSSTHRPWLVSPRFDVGWFLAPGLVAAAVGAAIALTSEVPAHLHPAFWLGSVLLVDVAHVYATLWRTYFDADARRLHRKRLIAAPLLCVWFGTLLHLESPRLFWSVLAYLAVFHFIKQHEGFAMLYCRAGHASARERAVAKWAVRAGTVAPVLWWHANLPRSIAWFRVDDFVVGLPEVVETVAVWAQIPILLFFVWTRLGARTDGRPNPMLLGLVLGPALTWNLGIVWFDDDRVFTLTNVVFHGVPYLALVWVAGGRTRVERALPRVARSTAALVVVFYGALAALAFVEEAFWDRLIWHERDWLFGPSSLDLSPLPAAFIVALLTMPQATHYLLDRWIWRAGPDNPRLAAQLGFDR